MVRNIGSTTCRYTPRRPNLTDERPYDDMFTTYRMVGGFDHPALHILKTFDSSQDSYISVFNTTSFCFFFFGKREASVAHTYRRASPPKRGTYLGWYNMMYNMISKTYAPYVQSYIITAVYCILLAVYTCVYQYIAKSTRDRKITPSLQRVLLRRKPISKLRFLFVINYKNTSIVRTFRLPEFGEQTMNSILILTKYVYFIL